MKRKTKGGKLAGAALAITMACTSQSEASCRCGDLDADGSVTATDALIVMQLATGRIPRQFGAVVQEGVELDVATIRGGDRGDNGLVAYVDPETGEFVDSPSPTNDSAPLGDVIIPRRCRNDATIVIAYVDPETGEVVVGHAEPTADDLREPAPCLRIRAAQQR
jgi:hypothetical protein